MTELVPPPDIARVFERAGWRPGRRVVDLPPSSAAHPAAQILVSFAGLVLYPDADAGVDCAPSDIRFGPVELRAPLVSEWAGRMAVTLVPVAEVHFSNDVLLVATDGRCFGFGYVDSAFFFLGHTLWEAASRLLQGSRAMPMLLPWESAVQLYGQVFTHESPNLYVPSTHATEKPR